MLRRALALSLIAVSLGGCLSVEVSRRPAGDPAADEAAIRAVLAAQVAAWNAGSLRGYMEGYAQTDSLRFASGGRVRYGWAPTLAGYEHGYPDRAAMGTLHFDSLDVRVLGPEWALAFGRWRLERAGDAPAGLFTLLLARRPEGWRIVHDHTSSE